MNVSNPKLTNLLAHALLYNQSSFEEKKKSLDEIMRAQLEAKVDDHLNFIIWWWSKLVPLHIFEACLLPKNLNHVWNCSRSPKKVVELEAVRNNISIELLRMMLLKLIKCYVIPEMMLYRSAILCNAFWLNFQKNYFSIW